MEVVSKEPACRALFLYFSFKQAALVVKYPPHRALKAYLHQKLTPHQKEK